MSTIKGMYSLNNSNNNRQNNILNIYRKFKNKKLRKNKIWKANLDKKLLKQFNK